MSDTNIGDKNGTYDGDKPARTNARTLLLDIEYMLDHVSGFGVPCPPTAMSESIHLIEEAREPNFQYDAKFRERLAINHQLLREAITPVTPASLRDYRYETQKDIIVWSMWVATSGFLLAFLWLSTSGAINPETVETNFLYRNGQEQLMVALLYLSAAGIGACFYNLVTMYRYLIAHKFDVAYKSSYAMRILLGLVAGYVLAEVIPIEAGNFSKPLLAMLGGFSADAVEAILTRFVDTLKAMVRGSLAEQLEAREQIAKSKADVREIQQKIESAKELSELLSTLPDDAVNNELREKLRSYLSKKLV